jgi:hypothetical protein
MRRSSLLTIISLLACSAPAKENNVVTPGTDTGVTPGAPAAIGAPCADGAACESGECKSDWPGGVCTKSSCDAKSCPEGSTCVAFGDGTTTCLSKCADACREGYVCGDAGACIPACDDTSCGEGFTCDAGRCVASDGAPFAEPTAVCEMPERDCTLGNAECGKLVPFEPVQGVGYDNYPINGETATNQYRSFARVDTMMLVKWAAAYVDCKAKGWGSGNHQPAGLGDMSEKDGAIPGTSIGSPGHPAGTHVNGFDMDIGYFQTTSPDNKLRPICEHKLDGKDQYHCVKEPHLLDLWRSSLFLGAFLSSPRIRVIGVDGKVGPLVLAAMPRLCAAGYLPAAACTAAKTKLAFEVTNEGRGWYQFHHHHLHISLRAPTSSGGFSSPWITPDMSSPAMSIEDLTNHHVHGHAFIE